MNTIEFLIKGSAPEPYKVIFKSEGTNVTMLCTCPAGEMRQYCKHRIGILSGDPTGIVSNNANDVKTVQSLIAGTDVEKALDNLADASEQFEIAKKKLSLSKKRLARALID